MRIRKPRKAESREQETQRDGGQGRNAAVSGSCRDDPSKPFPKGVFELHQGRWRTTPTEKSRSTGILIPVIKRCKGKKNNILKAQPRCIGERCESEWRMNASHHDAFVFLVCRCAAFGRCSSSSGGGSGSFFGMHCLFNLFQAHFENNIDVLVLCGGFNPS